MSSNFRPPLSTSPPFPGFSGTDYVDCAIGETNSGYTNIIVVEGVSYVRYRIGSLLFACFALSVGLIDMLAFVSKGVYFLHPSFDLLLLVGGFFLLLTTLLAIKGK